MDNCQVPSRFSHCGHDRTTEKRFVVVCFPANHQFYFPTQEVVNHYHKQPDKSRSESHTDLRRTLQPPSGAIKQN